MSDSKMKHYGLYMRTDQLAMLDVISQETEAPVSELIRRATDASLRRLDLWQPRTLVEEIEAHDRRRRGRRSGSGRGTDHGRQAHSGGSPGLTYFQRVTGKGDMLKTCKSFWNLCKHGCGLHALTYAYTGLEMLKGSHVDHGDLWNVGVPAVE
jgi:hypothetical protein